jgi:OOP family OmpA-OmpF porin
VQYVSHAKISVTPGKVSIYGLAATKEDKENLFAKLVRENTSSVDLVTEILVPRSAILPFTFRAVKSENYGRIDACSADNQLTKEQISMVVKAAGFETPFHCQTGLGMPDENWVRVIDIYVKTLRNLESGSLTISDTEITLVVPNGTRRQDFDALVADLRQKTPSTYQLRAVLPEPSLVLEPGKGEFIVTLSPEGFVQLRGGLSDELTKTTVTNMA